jgi:hypothetical protein
MTATAMTPPRTSKTIIVRIFSIIVESLQFQFNVSGGLLDLATPFAVMDTLMYLLFGEGYPRSFVGLDVVVFINPAVRD